MRCTACGSENPAEANFCNGRGAALSAHCVACGADNPAGSRFCNHCGGSLVGGRPNSAPLTANTRTPKHLHPIPRAYTPRHLAEKILTSRAALEGERKQVTVLFADVKGSMELAEQLDPEEWHRILDRFRGIELDLGDPSEYVRRNIYITTSGVDSVPPLLCALLAIGAEHILFATDYPFEKISLATEFLRTAPISEADRAKIAAELRLGGPCSQAFTRSIARPMRNMPTRSTSSSDTRRPD